MNQFDGDSDITPACLLPLCGEGSQKQKWPLPALLSRRKLSSPSPHSNVGQFSSSLYVSGVFQPEKVPPYMSLLP